MLNKIRQAQNNLIIKVIFMILLIFFALSLIDFTDHNLKYVAEIGKEKIPLDHFRMERDEAIKELNKKQYLTQEQVQNELVSINQQVLNKMIAKSILQQETKNLGITIPENIVAEFIRKEPSFMKNGVFDPETYRTILQLNNLNEQKLLDDIASQINSKFLLDTLSLSMPLKDKFTNYLKDYYNETRSISLFNLDFSKLKLKDLTEDEIKNFYSANAGLFQTAETRNVEYLLISKETIKAPTQITEQEIEAEFKANQEFYSNPETRDFAHFFIQDEMVSKELEAALKNNADHSKIAKDYINKQVILENFTDQPIKSFLQEINPKIFELQLNDVSEPVKTDLGWHIFKLIKLNERKLKSLADAKSEIKQNLINKFYETQIYEISKIVDDELASGEEIQEIAKRNNLTYANKIDISLQDKDMEPEIINLIFQAKLKEQPSLISLSDDRYVAFQVYLINEAKVKEFNEVTSQSKELLQQQKSKDLAIQIARRITEKLNEDENLFYNNQLDYSKMEKFLSQAFAEECNFSLKKLLSIDNLIISKIAQNSGISNIAITENTFRTAKNKFTVAMPNGEKIISFAKVNNISINQQIDKDIMKQINEIAEMNNKNLIYEQYLEYLKGKYKVKVNNHLIDQ